MSSEASKVIFMDRNGRGDHRAACGSRQDASAAPDIRFSDFSWFLMIFGRFWGFWKWNIFSKKFVLQKSERISELRWSFPINPDIFGTYMISTNGFTWNGPILTKLSTRSDMDYFYTEKTLCFGRYCQSLKIWRRCMDFVIFQSTKETF